MLSLFQALLKLLVVIDKTKTMIGSSKIDLADMLNKNILGKNNVSSKIRK